MKRIFANLVTAKPPREVKGDTVTSIVQDLSSNNTLAVPQDDSQLAERERSLLLYDAAFTPSDLPGAYGIDPWALDTARVVRASKLANDRLPAVDYSELTPEISKKLEEIQGHYLGQGKYHQLSAARTRLETLTGVRLMDHETRDQIETIDWAPWESAVNYARALMEKAKERGERPTPPPPGNPGKDEQGDGDQPDDSWLDHTEHDPDEDEKPPEGSAEEREKKQLEASVIPNPETGAKPRISRFNPDPWAKGTIPKGSQNGTPGRLENPEKPDILPMESVRKKMGVKRRPEMEGAVPSAFHRFLVDRKIFKGAKVRGGLKTRGTVLVDMSGSMSWTPEDFAEMITVLPECSVYGYAGYSGGNAGRLVLLADRGKAAKMEAISNWKSGKGSNVVDDSALRFLAKCSRPRVWISDGGVTGCRDQQTPYITTLCNAAIVAGGIIRVRRAHDAVKILQGRR